MNHEEQLREALDEQPVDLEQAWQEQLWRIGASPQIVRLRRSWVRPLIAAACVVAAGGAVITGFQLNSATTTPAAPAVPIVPLDPADVGDQALPFPSSLDDPWVGCGNGSPNFASSLLFLGDQGGQHLKEMRAALALADSGPAGPLRGVPAAKARFHVLVTSATIQVETGEPGSTVDFQTPVPTADASEIRVLLAIGEWGPEGPIGDESGYAVLAGNEDTYSVVDWGDCALTPALKPGLGWAGLSNASGDPSSSVLTVDVTEVGCTGARDPAAYLQEPVMVETDASVTISWATTESLGADCPGNPSVTRQLQLAEPLGNRTILDGSTWPATPLR